MPSDVDKLCPVFRSISDLRDPKFCTPKLNDADISEGGTSEALSETFEC